MKSIGLLTAGVAQLVANVAKHPTSSCDSNRGAQLLTAACLANDAVVYLVVVVHVEGVRYHAFLYAGAERSYASATLLDRIGVRAGRRQVRKIKMMLGVATPGGGNYKCECIKSQR